MSFKQLESERAIREIDRNNMLKGLLEYPSYFRSAWELAREKIDLGEIDSVVMCGVGGSGVGCMLVEDIYSSVSPIPLIHVGDFELPRFLSEKTLVILVSYSGNTEEVIRCGIDALDKGCKIVVISSGGRLKEKIGEKAVFIELPKEIRVPRLAFPYLFMTILRVLAEVGIISVNEAELEKAFNVLDEMSREFSPAVKIDKNEAKRVAAELFGKTPIIYAYKRQRAIAHRFKSQLNENCKMRALEAELPELLHNEIVAWEKDFSEKDLVVLVRWGLEKPWVKERFELLKEALMGKAKILEIRPRGDSELSWVLSTIYLIDFSTFYLSILRKVDPVPVKSIDWFKREVRKRVRVP